MSDFLPLFAWIFGIVMGWLARSVWFACDHECANPDHNSRSREEPKVDL